ncbi:hypothetical protein SJI19_16980 [Acerihabitans sp. TG2]|uniref:hypothetical protein n=1 Tax=Acerihabitans sp. TG2 TaxID=3096008 RepID=UPI002B22F192|nr:hypothetical protein [Acerihabitans sp. TG2]MEA9392221.1 hypothetical protein [Acerihabitans sp. TG2]
MKKNKLSFGAIVGITFGSLVFFLIITIVIFKFISKKQSELPISLEDTHQSHSENQQQQKADTERMTKDIVESQLAARDQQLSTARHENEQLKNTVNQIVAITDRNNKLMMARIDTLDGRISALERLLSIETTKNRQINVIHLDKLQKNQVSQQAVLEQKIPLNGLSIISIVGDRAWISDNGKDRSVTNGDFISGRKKGSQLQIVDIDADKHTITLK